MYYSTGSKSSLRLAQDDMDGIAYLYPRNEPGDGVWGCGTISLPSPPSGSGPFLFWCLALPYVAIRWQRFKIQK